MLSVVLSTSWFRRLPTSADWITMIVAQREIFSIDYRLRHAHTYMALKYDTASYTLAFSLSLYLSHSLSSVPYRYADGLVDGMCNACTGHSLALPLCGWVRHIGLCIYICMYHLYLYCSVVYSGQRIGTSDILKPVQCVMQPVSWWRW